MENVLILLIWGMVHLLHDLNSVCVPWLERFFKRISYIMKFLQI